MNETMNVVVERPTDDERRLVQTKVAPRRHRLDPIPAKTATARVLIVDDEPEIAISLSKRLIHAGYEVLVAHDGLYATKMAFKELPDVIILDIGMPCGDGHTVADRIRNNPQTVFTPIIYLTARTSDADKERAAEAGAFAYVTKPFRADELLALVDDAVKDWEREMGKHLA